MDEAALKSALDGKFFWEKTTKYDGSPPKEVLAIRRVQRKYMPKDLPEEYKAPMEWWKARLPDAGFQSRLDRLRQGIVTALGVSEADLASRTSKKVAAFPKKFFMWCLCRYFNVSISQMAKKIDRDHTTIIYGRDAFESEKHLHAELIQKMDEYMGYKPQ
jgi:hypothetical protein